MHPKGVNLAPSVESCLAQAPPGPGAIHPAGYPPTVSRAGEFPGAVTQAPLSSPWALLLISGQILCLKLRQLSPLAAAPGQQVDDFQHYHPPANDQAESGALLPNPLLMQLPGPSHHHIRVHWAPCSLSSLFRVQMHLQAPEPLSNLDFSDWKGNTVVSQLVLL